MNIDVMEIYEFLGNVFYFLCIEEKYNLIYHKIVIEGIQIIKYGLYYKTREVWKESLPGILVTLLLGIGDTGWCI